MANNFYSRRHDPYRRHNLQMNGYFPSRSRNIGHMSRETKLGDRLSASYRNPIRTTFSAGSSSQSGSRRSSFASSLAYPAMASLDSFLPKAVTMSAKNHPDVRRIVSAFKSTLGRLPNQYDFDKLTPVPFTAGCDSLEQLYANSKEEVSEFCQSVDILSCLPCHELEDNMQNWLDVLVLRSAWWFTYIDEDDMDVIRINKRFGLHRNSDKALEPLFSLAETIMQMELYVEELALVITYLLLNGQRSYQSPCETAMKREHILKLLYNCQKEIYPEDSRRHIRLLHYLPEITFIARTI